MDTILIGTTATNRPDLHNLIFPKWKKWLLESGKKLVWVINIDTIEYLQETYETTKKNFEMLLDDIHKLIILPLPPNNFLGACKNISNCIKDYVENNNLNKDDLNVIWLEDDWELLDTDLTLNTLLKYSAYNTHINLSGIANNYIWALAPSILSYHFWEDIYYDSWQKQLIDIDAEKCVGNYFINKYNYDQSDVINITIDGKGTNNLKILFKENPVFIKLRPLIALDKGIEYLKDKFVKKKWVKTGRKIVTFTYEKI